MDVQAPVSLWIVGASVALLCGCVFDGVGLLPGDWGRAESDTYYMTIGLWRVCLGRRNVTDSRETTREAPRCTFPSQTAAGRCRTMQNHTMGFHVCVAL